MQYFPNNGHMATVYCSSTSFSYLKQAKILHICAWRVVVLIDCPKGPLKKMCLRGEDNTIMNEFKHLGVKITF